jgi:hypothetical protein
VKCFYGGSCVERCMHACVESVALKCLEAMHCGMWIRATNDSDEKANQGFIKSALTLVIIVRSR